MTLRDYLDALRRSWIIIVAAVLLGAVAGYGYAKLQPEMYGSEASVVVIPARGDSTSELVQGSSYVQSLVRTYAVVATSPTVLNPVIDQLGLHTSPQALAGAITVDSPLNTVVMRIAVVGQDPEQTTRIADAVAKELAVAVKELSPQNAQDQPAVRIEMIAPAKVPQFPTSPNVRMMVVAGAALGLLAGVIFALLRLITATRVSNRADIAGATDVALLGEISQTGGTRSLPAAIRADATGSAAESVRSIVANLRFANVDGDTKVLLVTSGSSGEGKSSVSVALGQTMAEQGARVLVVDADLRRASIASLTQIEGSVGLTSVLLGDVDIKDAVQPWGTEKLDILTSGQLPPNPVQLLTSDHLRRFFEAVREEYDVVVVDTPPVLAVSDPLWVAPNADGIIVITRAKVTKRDAIRRTIAALETSRVPVVGIILNGSKRTEGSPYYRPAERRPSRRSKPDTVA